MDIIENCVLIEDICLNSSEAHRMFTIALSCSSANMGPLPP